MAALDLPTLHNKAQFLSSFFEGLATAKQLPASLRPHLAFGRATCKHFLKPNQRMQHICNSKLTLDKSFDLAAYTVVMDVLRQLPEVKSNAGLMGAVGKMEEAVKVARHPTLTETVETLQVLSKEMPLPQNVLKPTLLAMTNAGVFDTTEVDEVAGKISAFPFTPDQMWDAVADRIDFLKDGRVATFKKLGKSPNIQQNVTKAGYFQIVDVPKDKQFAMMPITPSLANAMACGPQRANFTQLDKCDHPAARALIEDLTNILLIGTNVADQDREKSIAVTLRSIANDPMAVSFRTIIDKSMAQPAPSSKQPGAGTSTKTAMQAPSTKTPAAGETNVMEIFEKLKQMGAGVSVKLELLEAVFAQLVAGGVAQPDEVEKAKGELKTKADPNGEVSFPAIQEVFMNVFGSKFAK